MKKLDIRLTKSEKLNARSAAGYESRRTNPSTDHLGRRVIYKYKNRKLRDNLLRRYITVDQLHGYILQNIPFVVRYMTKEGIVDITEAIIRDIYARHHTISLELMLQHLNPRYTLPRTLPNTSNTDDPRDSQDLSCEAQLPSGRY